MGAYQRVGKDYGAGGNSDWKSNGDLAAVASEICQIRIMYWSINDPLPVAEISHPNQWTEPVLPVVVTVVVVVSNWFHDWRQVILLVRVSY